MCIHAAADRERAVASGADVVPFDLFAKALVDAMAGLLAAPASAATMRRLRDTGEVGAGRLRLLCGRHAGSTCAERKPCGFA